MLTFAEMQRRVFLRRASALMAGGTATLANTDVAAVRGAETTSRDDRRPIAALASAEDEMARVLADALDGEYEVRRSEALLRIANSREQRIEVQKEMAEVLKGCSALVVGPLAFGGGNEAAEIDAHTRGLYDLLTAAIGQQISLVVYLSTLDLMAAYAPEYTVDEGFQSMPTTASRLLSRHLGEFVCREFAREGALRCLVLRIGRLAGRDKTRSSQPDQWTVSSGELGRVVRRALVVGLASPPRVANWEVFHIHSTDAAARFNTSKAVRLLGWHADHA